uniref:AlNc14C73G5000 protein n=1 Tax=Albugo laibachii Nc14 TaxID=890382 RepID=F0WEE3_9STRA|nr:AlNc14C73G5000 [Albugo laibachii Nc14]|eukprot:CCA19575.1 AlNc14C73G5000 [Albugo laibachii Nc14]
MRKDMREHRRISCYQDRNQVHLLLLAITSKNQLLSRPQPSAPPATGNPPSPGSGNPPPRPVRQSGANTQQTPPVQPAATANPTRPVINGGDPAQQGTTTTANGGGNGPPPRTHTNAESSEEEPASQETQTSGANKKASTIQKATLGVGIAGALGAGTASVLGGVVVANQQAANTTTPSDDRVTSTAVPQTGMRFLSAPPSVRRLRVLATSHP